MHSISDYQPGVSTLSGGGGGRERGGSIELVQTVSQVDQLRQRAVAAERSGAMIDLTESDGEEEGEIRERDR